MDRLDAALATIDASKTDKARLEACCKAQKRLRDEYELHVTQYREQYARNMVALVKERLFAPAPGAMLQTSAWTQGDVRKMREPPPKKEKKSKKPNLDVSAASAAETSPKGKATSVKPKAKPKAKPSK